MERIYAAIDLKSFYASCECAERGLDPLTTNLVVADESRTAKTICLAVSPSLKSYGIKGRPRLFEVISKVKKINEERRKKVFHFTDKSINNNIIKLHPQIELDFLIAKPRMSLYIDYSTRIYQIYLKHVSKEDIFVYSIDEVFIDITDYLKYTKKTKEEFVTDIILDIYKETKISATGGIGDNLYLAKVAMDILAKHVKPNKDNVRIAYLDIPLYRKLLWSHQPLTDFWRIGRGYIKTLEENKLFTMGDIALYSINHEDELFDLFGVNAEILIDHAWGYEPCTIRDVKNYSPSSNSLSTTQVLKRPYNYSETKLIVQEMVDVLTLDLISKDLCVNKISLTIDYDSENLNNNYSGNIKNDYYGRKVPKESHGTISIDYFTVSSKKIMEKTMKLFEKIIKPSLTCRRITLTYLDVIKEKDSINKNYQQTSLFENQDKTVYDKKEEEKDKKISQTLLNLKKKYGKNSVIKGMNLLDASTARERNEQIGGHHE